MANYYNLDGIKTELSKDIKKAKAVLEAWEKVNFPTKKDGSPFKVLSKNIDGATLYKPEFSMQPGENRLRVTAFADGSGWVSSEIDTYCLVKYLKDENKKAKKENYMPKQTYLEQVYSYDLEDIKEAVATEIERLKEKINDLEHALTISDAAYKNFRDGYKEIMLQLEKDTDKTKNSTLFYMISETIKNRFPYC